MDNEADPNIENFPENFQESEDPEQGIEKENEATGVDDPEVVASQDEGGAIGGEGLAEADGVEEVQGGPSKMRLPEGQEDMPDLFNLLDSLKQENSDIEVIKREAELFFPDKDKAAVYEKIDELRLQIEEEELKSYMLDFETGVKDEVLMLGSISLDDVQEEEKRLRNEHVQYLEQEAVRKRTQQEDILKREEEAKKRMAAFVKEKREFLERREEILRQREKLLMDRLHRGFIRAESQLISVLESRKGEVKTFYGDLMHCEGQYAGSKGRRWKVDWNKTPQPIQIKLKCLRGIKDKCPAGRYVMMVSLYNRIGGHPMRWSRLKGQQWGSATLPLFHEGNFHNVEIKINQSMFTVLPPKPSVRPGMVLVFELFLLRGSVVNTDHVVAWGCFPICDSQFEVVEGRYMSPFLRGPMDPDIDKHEKIEQLIASDLDHWMANLYFEVIRLPRYFAGQKEYEVELQFSSGLTGHPDRVRTGWEENRDGEDPMVGSSGDVSTDGMTPSGLSTLSVATPGGSLDTGRQPNRVRIASPFKGEEKKKRMPTTVQSRVFQKDYKRMKLPDSDEEDSEDDNLDEVSEEKMVQLEQESMRKEKELKPVRGMEGLYYKRYHTSPADAYFKHMFTMIPKTELIAPKKKERKLTRVEELEKHTFSVQPPFTGKGQMAKEGREKLNYMARQFAAELGISQWRSRDFWGMMIMFVVIFWIRLYLHYIGQWLFLSAIDIPINQFEFLPYTVNLNYQPTLLETRDELTVVVLGPMMNVVAFSFLVVLAWLIPKFMGLLPDIGSKFIMAYGIMTFFDPLLILIVDWILGRNEDLSVEPIADFCKLYWHFDRSQGEGLPGIFLVIFLYCFTSFFAASILYMYFLRLHNNGRLLDVFWRLRGEEDQFFKPYDLELSNQELCYICRKAEQWRGEEGARRKVAVFDYVWEEEEMDDENIWDESNQEVEKRKEKKEITTHVSVHTLHLDGLRELHRHFLRLPDGAIVEVFGDISIPGMDKDVKAALEKGSRGIENIFGSQSRVRGRQEVHTANGFRDNTSTSSRPQSSTSSIKKEKNV